MNIEEFRLLFDFGLLVMIWMVQLVVYPSFLFYQKQNLLEWHKKYTLGISLVVIPLMFGQLITAILQLINTQNLHTTSSLTLILLVWAITFIFFVPMHGKINTAKADEILLRKLVKQNWWRVFLWTLIFVCTFLTTV